MGKKKAVTIKTRVSVSKRALPGKKSAKVIPSKHGKLSDQSKSRPSAANLFAEVKKTASGFPVVGIAFVIIQHLDPKHKSIMDELLKRHTTMKVLQAANGLKLEPNSVYLNPPDKDVGIFNGKFQLTDPVEAHRIRLPINNFFRSLHELN
jgi:CheB methylesterase